MEAPDFQKSIVIFIWVSDMLPGVGKCRYTSLHGGICVVVMLHNNLWLYIFGLLFFSKMQLDDWDMDIPTCGVELLEQQSIFLPLNFDCGLGA